MKCISCRTDTKIKIVYPFCEDCFLKHYERKVERVIKRYKLIRKGDRILIAISGGKDSLSCAHVLSRLRARLSFQLGALHIDVGIQECTNERTERVVRSFCEERNIPFHFVKFDEYLKLDVDIKRISSHRPLCSTCGMFKRYIFNKFARENNYNKIATGHCADDIMRFFFKNWLAQQFDWIAKLKPYTPSNHPKVVPRIRPLFECLEKENLLYAKLNYIIIAGCSRCSYFLRKDKWNDLLKLIDEKRPDFKINFVRGLEVVNLPVSDKCELRECQECGEPTDRAICAVCTLRKYSQNSIPSFREKP